MNYPMKGATHLRVSEVRLFVVDLALNECDWLGTVYWVQTQTEIKGYGFIDGLKEKFMEIINKQKEDKDYIIKFLEPWFVQAKITDGIMNELDEIDISKLDIKEVKKCIFKISDSQRIMWKNNPLPEMADAFDIQIINECGVSLNGEEITKMVTSENLTFYQIVDHELHNGAKILYEKGEQSEEFKAIVNNLQQKYYFIQNSWGTAKILDKKYFIKRLKEVLHEQKIGEMIDYYDKYKKNIVEQKQAIIDKYDMSPNVQNVLRFFGLLAENRDLRKYYVQRVHHYMFLLEQRFSELSGIDREIIDFARTEEVVNFKEEYVEEWKKRKQGYVHFRLNGKTIIKNSEEAEEIIHKLHSIFHTKEELTGQSAYLGKVEGTVKVINEVKEFSKFEKGDVLVTGMTRPEYLPLMRQAAAIVTDEGGITSHAAIVARELQKPCIIGTQRATIMLKDGDKVEVDANNGVVKVIK